MFNVLPGRGIEGKINGQEMLIGTDRLLSERGVTGLNEAETWVREQGELGRTTVFLALAGKLMGAIALADRVKDEAVSAGCPYPQQAFRKTKGETRQA